MDETNIAQYDCVFNEKTYPVGKDRIGGNICGQCDSLYRQYRWRSK